MPKNKTNYLYDHVMDDLKKQVITKYQVGDRLPSEREICETYDVSRITVRQALQLLEEQGYVRRRHGSGTYVSDRWQKTADIANYFSFTDRIRAEGGVPHSEIISFNKIEAAGFIAKEMGLAEGTYIYELIRLRKADGEPLIYEKTYMPMRLFPKLTKSRLSGMPLYEVMRKDYEFVIDFADDEVHASLLEIEEAKALKQSYHQPCLRIFRKTYSTEGDLIEFTIDVARSDHFGYTIRHHGNGLTS